MMNLQVHSAIASIPAPAWNRLAGADAPFLRHEFLAAMERHGCVGERFGWIPQHLALYDTHGTLVAAAPAYLKFNSYGEFVFDWSWADAYQRAGESYYPKLVIASPYTPATGPRLLTLPGPERESLARALIAGARQLADKLNLSGAHWLFGSAEELAWQEADGYLARLGCQFHWHNQGYADFTQLLEQFTAEKRKKIKRERRRVTEAGVRLRRLRGDQVSEADWVLFHGLYEDTFDKRGGLPTLSLAFFQDIAQSMGEQLLLVLADFRDQTVAAAFCLVGARTLYGRHWGCSADFHSLHFEACYYQGLEHCIHTGLTRFEPGAQGEHKLARGFLPTATWSAHWIADSRFRQPIARFLEHERAAMQEYLTDMQQHSPYKHPPQPASEP
ncbi:GNAT family N-acetyltransferase [Rhabdochromatium marinum]|uniref:GNAT family N-acetyltransferase n=1 Tax=Rhabdochromatium marinum TaxID=48729 RepID=UPI0019078AE9|nr:GNAT family N-acetyltransferase [Rhabdochromatium marinum]MBK1648140.1 GNAT family N-acetyltransferase [Rhabdochromatium marinum]